MLKLSDGRTLDEVFAPYEFGTKECPVGEMHIDGQDIRDRYAPLSTGDKAPDVNYHIDNIDISNYFAAFGTVSAWNNPESWNGQTFSDGGTDENGGGRLYLSVWNDGNVVVYSGSSGYREYERNPIPSTVSASNVEVRCVQNSGPGAITNTLSTWTPLTGLNSLAGEVEYRLSVIGENTGNFTLEFREISNITRGTTGDFVFYLKVIDRLI